MAHMLILLWNWKGFSGQQIVPSNISRSLKSRMKWISCFVLCSYEITLTCTFSLYVVKMLNCRPITILRKSLIGTARSSLFLSVYCASAWLASCSVHYYFVVGCLVAKLVLFRNNYLWLLYPSLKLTNDFP